MILEDGAGLQTGQSRRVQPRAFVVAELTQFSEVFASFDTEGFSGPSLCQRAPETPEGRQTVQPHPNLVLESSGPQALWHQGPVAPVRI